MQTHEESQLSSQDNVIIERFKDIAIELGNKHYLSFPPVPYSAIIATAWALNKILSKTVVLVVDNPVTLETVHLDTIALRPSDKETVLYYPPRPTHGVLQRHSLRRAGSHREDDIIFAGWRMRVLLDLALFKKIPDGNNRETKPRIITTCIQSLMQKTYSAEGFLQNIRHICSGKQVLMEDLVTFLEQNGYKSETRIMQKGQIAIRGGLIDVWLPVSRLPLRIEFENDMIASLRFFDPHTQRSIEKIHEIYLTPAGEIPVMSGARKKDAYERAKGTFFEYLCDGSIFIWSDLTSISEHSQLYEELAEETEDASHVLKLSEIETIRQNTVFWHVETGGTRLPEEKIDAVSIPVPFVRGREVFQPDIVEKIRHQFLAELSKKVWSGYTAFMFFESSAMRDHVISEIETVLQSNGRNRDWTIEECKECTKEKRCRKFVPAKGEGIIHFCVGKLSSGFISDNKKIMVVSQYDLYGLQKIRTGTFDPYPYENREPVYGETGGIVDYIDFEPGELVVHAEHGIARYLGLNEINVGGIRQEVLTLEFANKTKLHVPVFQAHLLSRYIGIPHRSVEVHKLGSARWQKEKQTVENYLNELAHRIIEVQARRKVMNGYAFPPDTSWQHEFESAFPFQETPDQLKAIEKVKQFMESSQPMDLLICGDASYGKTEVAMRAAFKAVMGGRQVAVLVPTTVLAQQHFLSFTERMSAYPVRIEMLSRLVPPARQKEILTGLINGSVDIVIGTHALLQQAVRFRNLGLVIIDEEQRFGVLHKEYFKQMYSQVDVLTLTATPIPRTLYLTLTGIIDIVRIETPPRERVLPEIIITRESDAVIREAILRELEHGGQVYFLHNRIATISKTADRLQKLVPQAKIGIAHGRMPPRQLAETMKKFMGGEFDILLCTNIVESGVDIPRANTIIIERADRFGLADLYQLRGRVGRAGKKGYAWLLLPEHGEIDSDARRRLNAIQMYSTHGVSFKIAVRDMEIRGAGNIVGREQSGHIATVGFTLYCQLLRQAIARIKGEYVPPPVQTDLRLDFISLSTAPDMAYCSACIPYQYIEDETLRVSAYRKIAEALSTEEIERISEEFRDRFGPLPSQVERLLKIAKLRIIASTCNISCIEVRERKIMITRNGDYIMTSRKMFPRLVSETPDKMLDELIKFVQSLRS
jgi:transcription-repair coupling factor (superfamily II helicase)